MQPSSISPTFRALRSRSINGDVSSVIESIAVQELSPGEVVLRTLYAGINYKDCLAILGKAKIITAFPRIAGIEAVGVVAASECAEFREGDLVLVHGHQTGIAFDGGFSEYLRVPKEHLQQVPNGLTPLECAVVGVPGFTVAMALERFEELGLSPGSGLVAVSGAGGAVGMLAIAILSKAGYPVAAITRRMDRAPILRAMGASEVIDAAILDQAQRPLEKARFIAAIDNVGGPMLSWLLRSMQDGGCVASVGNAAGNTFDGSVLPFIMRRVQLFGVVANAPWAQRRRLWERLSSSLKPDFEHLMPQVHCIDLDELMGHAARQLNGQTNGRTLLQFDGVAANPPDRRSLLLS